MRHGWIFVWRLPSGIAPAERTRFHATFYGHKTSSHSGQYAYRRQGLLDDIPHRKLGRGVILVGDRDRGKVEAVLEQFAEELHVRRVRLEPEDEEAKSSGGIN
jgi:hypothetical protein